MYDKMNKRGDKMNIRTDRILQLMTKNKMSYQDLADITHVHKSTLQRYTTGKTQKIPVIRLWPIAFALNTTPEYLLGETDDPNPSYANTISNDLQHKTINAIHDLNPDQLKSVYAFIQMITKEDL